MKYLFALLLLIAPVFAQTVSTPLFTPPSGTLFANGQIVTVTSATSGAKLCYTVDGSTPAAATAGTCSHGTTLTNGGTVNVSATETVNVLGTLSGSGNSSVAAAAYIVGGGVTSNIDDIPPTSSDSPSIGWATPPYLDTGCGDPGGATSYPHTINNVTPSLDGFSSLFTVGGPPEVCVGWFYNAGPQDLATRLINDFEYQSGSTNSTGNANEFDLYQYVKAASNSACLAHDTEFYFGSQCVTSTGNLQIWDEGGTGWHYTSPTISCASGFASGAYHHITMQEHWVCGDTSGTNGYPKQWYDSITIDGTIHYINTAYSAMALPGGYGENTGVNMELDIGSAGTSLSSNIDEHAISFLPAVSAPWTSVLSQSRAVNWSSAGAPHMNDTRTQCGSTIAAGASAATISAAMQACSANGYVQLGTGAFSLSAALAASNSNYSLRGMGADNTTLSFTGHTSSLAFCGQNAPGGGNICVSSSDTNYVEGPSNTATFAGSNGASGTYTQGATSLLLTGITGTAPVVGQAIILDQIDDQSDPGNLYVGCELYDSSAACYSGAGPGGYARNGGSLSTIRGQQQMVTVISISNVGGTYTLGVSPGLYAANWATAKSPQAWWATRPVSNVGIENMSIDISGDNPSDSSGTVAPAIVFFNCLGCWAKGVRSIMTTSPRATGQSHIEFYMCAHCEAWGNYIYGNYGTNATDEYTFAIQIASDLLIENNIVQAPPNFALSSSDCEGCVWDYNFGAGSTFFQTDLWNNQNVQPHAILLYGLYEGNIGNGIYADSFHGSHELVTAFRNRFDGIEQNGVPGGGAILPTNNTIPVIIGPASRGWNFVGNVLGTPGYHNTYKTIPTSYASQITSIYSLGVYPEVYSGCSGTACRPIDALTSTTSLFWGNWDTVSNAVRWCGNSTNTGWTTTCSSTSEVPAAGFPNGTYSNAVPATQTLPPSFMYTSQPSFLSGKPWPLTGPDVSTGNVGQCTTGTYQYSEASTSAQCSGGTFTPTMNVTSNPAMDCYFAMGGVPNGTGVPLNSFDSAHCPYLVGGTGAPAVTLAPTSLSFGSQTTGTTSAAQTVTLTNSGTSSLSITSILLGGANPNFYAITSNTCSSSLTASSSCTVLLTFSPVQVQSYPASLIFTTNAVSSPNTLTLAGSGGSNTSLGGGGSASQQFTISMKAQGATFNGLPLMPQQFVNGNEWQGTTSNVINFPASGSGGSWTCLPSTSYGPYTANSVSSLQTAGNDAEACRTANGSGTLIVLPAGALFSGTSTETVGGGSEIATFFANQTAGDTSTNFIVLLSSQPAPAGATVCSHGIQDVLAESNDPGYRNFGCGGTALSYQLGQTVTPVASNTEYNDVSEMPTLECPTTNCSVFATGPLDTNGMAPHHWAVEYVELRPQAGLVSTAAIVKLGVGNETAVSQLPSYYHFGYCYPHGDWTDTTTPTGFNQVPNGFFINATHWSIDYCYLDRLLRPGSEGHLIDVNLSQYGKIDHSWLEGESIGIFTGGYSAAVPIANFNQSDLQITSNRITYPWNWILAHQAAYAPSQGSFDQKNRLEMKVGLRTVIDGNIIEHSDDSGAQNGPLATFKTDNTSGGSTGSNYGIAQTDTTITDNLFRDSCNGVDLGSRSASGGGNGGGVALASQIFSVQNNILEDINVANPGCGGIGVSGPQYGWKINGASNSWTAAVLRDATGTFTTATLVSAAGLTQSDFNPGDPVNVSGCSDTSFNTGQATLGPPALSGTVPTALTVLYTNAGTAGAGAGVTGCAVTNTQGWMQWLLFSHNTDILAGTGPADPYSPCPGGSGPFCFARSLSFTNSIFVGGGPNAVYGEGTRTTSQGFDPSTLTFNNLVFAGRSAASCPGGSGAACYAQYPGAISPPTNVYVVPTANCTGAVPTSGCVGFNGVLSTSTIPSYLSDWTQWALNAKSSFAAGGVDQATDGTDMGAHVASINSAEIANRYACPYACSPNAPYPDATPQIEILIPAGTPSTYFSQICADPNVAGITITEYWSDFDLGSGSSHTSYDFTIPNAQIAPWANCGGKRTNIVLQQIPNSSGSGTCAASSTAVGHNGLSGTGNCATPPWVWTMEGSANYANCGTDGSQFSNYFNPAFVTAYQNAVAAFVNNFATSPTFHNAYIRVGLGHGGEMLPNPSWSGNCLTTLVGWAGLPNGTTSSTFAADWVTAWLAPMSNFMGGANFSSAVTPIQLMGAVTPMGTDTFCTGCQVPDLIAPIYVANRMGFGSQGLEASDVNNINGTADWVRLFNLYHGLVPLELQTEGQTCPGGAGNGICGTGGVTCSIGGINYTGQSESSCTGNLGAVFTWGSQNYATIEELYWQDWALANISGYSTQPGGTGGGATYTFSANGAAQHQSIVNQIQGQF